MYGSLHCTLHSSWYTWCHRTKWMRIIRSLSPCCCVGRSEILAAVLLKIRGLWDATLCHWASVYLSQCCWGQAVWKKKAIQFFETSGTTCLITVSHSRRPDIVMLHTGMVMCIITEGCLRVPLPEMKRGGLCCRWSCWRVQDWFSFFCQLGVHQYWFTNNCIGHSDYGIHRWDARKYGFLLPDTHKGKGKGKVHPRTGHEVSQGE